MTKKLAFDGNHFWLLLLFVGAPTVKWWIEPEKTFVQAFAPYAVVLAFIGWFAIAYKMIAKFKNPVLGWSMVVVGFSALLYSTRWLEFVA